MPTVIKKEWILHMLRKEVGDTYFKKIIQAYYQQYKGSNADTRDFQQVAEKVSGKNLTTFLINGCTSQDSGIEASIQKLTGSEVKVA